MKTLLVSSVAWLVATAGTLAPAAEIQSGLRIGEPADAYIVTDCTGPDEGKTFCLR